ncbi:MAG: IS200/IS605 family element transposase accessory protein TnpB [Chloroflexi bacterium]|nr:IS200/IS605 family element transposase accessory protein TnpB [Chloroflexota bacterium]
MMRSHKIRLNPTPDQEAYFRRAVGTARFVYNWGLAAWKQCKAEHPGEPHGVMTLKKDFNAIKASQFPWVYDVAKDVAEGAFANLGSALANYYNSKNGHGRKKIGFPKFKSKKHMRQTFRLNNDRIATRGNWLPVPRLGWVNMAEPLRLDGKIMNAVVMQEGGKWYVSITVEMTPPPPKTFDKPIVGVDLGIKILAVLSDGTQYANPTLLRSELGHLMRLSRRLSRRKKASQRWKKAMQQLRKFHQRIAWRRRDYLHKMTTRIAQTYAVIGLEDLHVAGLLKNRRLAMSLADAAFGKIRIQLEYKSAWFGGRVIVVNRYFPSSQLCSHCGEKHASLKLSEREWTCGNCDAVNERDPNAARNIEAEALRQLNQSPVVAPSGTRLVDGT